MTSLDDDLAALKRAVDRATPRPDPTVRAAHLRLATERFDARRRLGGRLAGPPGPGGRLRAWIGRLGVGGLAMAATVLVAGVFVLLPAGQQLWERPKVSEAVRPTPEAALGSAGQPTSAEAPELAQEAARAETSGPELEPDPSPAEARTLAREAVPADATEPSQRTALAEAPASAPPAALSTEAADAVAPEAESGAATAGLSAAPPDPWAAVRDALRAGALPPPEAVRLAEMVAAVPDASLQPVPGSRAALSVVPAPWDTARWLVRIDAEAPGRIRAAWEGAEARPLGEDAAAGPRVFEVTPVEAPVLRLTVGESTVALPLAPTGAPGLAAAVAGFAWLLQGADLGGWTFADAVALAEASQDAEPAAAEAEIVALMRQAQALAD